MQKVSLTALTIAMIFFLSVDVGIARDGEKEILNATMTIITDDSQSSVHANRILLPARMQARVQEIAESRRRKGNAPTFVVPANNQLNGGRLNTNPFSKKSESLIGKKASGLD